MSGGALIPLNGGRSGRKTVKQAEIRLAGLLKILRIRCSGHKVEPDSDVASGPATISAGYG
jgi:hypothetical protein